VDADDGAAVEEALVPNAPVDAGADDEIDEKPPVEGAAIGAPNRLDDGAPNPVVPALLPPPNALVVVGDVAPNGEDDDVAAVTSNCFEGAVAVAVAPPPNGDADGATPNGDDEGGVDALVVPNGEDPPLPKVVVVDAPPPPNGLALVEP
jgi:hypothetical protein